VQDSLGSKQAGVASIVLQIGLQAFPILHDSLEGLQTCRRFRDQVVSSLDHTVTLNESSEWLELAERLAEYFYCDGFYVDAIQWLTSTWQIRKAVPGDVDVATLRSMYNLAVSYGSLGRTKEAAQLLEETLEIQKRALGPEHPDTLWSMNGLAASYGRLGRAEEAARLHEETLEIQKRALGPEHPDTLRSMNNLAVSYWSLGRTKEAAQLHEETLEKRKRALTPA